MARKIKVNFNGKTIGTRTTDRLYTHALVLTDFNPEVVRKRSLDHEAAHAKDDASSWNHYTLMATTPVGTVPTATRKNQYRGNIELAWPWPVSQEEKDKAIAYLDGVSLEQYQARQKAARLQRIEAHIAKCISQGATVLSYHGSRDLAFKAQASASKTHPEYLVLVEPVQA